MESSCFLSSRAIAARVLRASFGVQLEQPHAKGVPRLGAFPAGQVAKRCRAGAGVGRQPVARRDSKEV